MSIMTFIDTKILHSDASKIQFAANVLAGLTEADLVLYWIFYAPFSRQKPLRVLKAFGLLIQRSMKSLYYENKLSQAFIRKK